MNSLARHQRTAAIIGAIGLVACLLGGVFARPRAAQAYWFAWLFWTGLGTGALSILLLHHLSGGAWGHAVSPVATAAALTLPFAALALIPALFTLAEIFPWAHTGGLAAEWTHKRAFLTQPWFIVRAFLYLLALISIAGALRLRPRAAQFISGGGIVLFAGCMLFASTDWFMSLEPGWSSTMLVVIVMTANFLSALALCVVLALASNPAIAVKQLHDLGNLLLAFVTFWIYVSFSQFLIIWSGNLPREISWYLHRGAGGWQVFAGVLALLQFAVPFALLLSRAAKRHRERLLPIAALIFLASIAQTYWLVVPSFTPRSFQPHWLDAAAFLGLGGFWTALFLNRLTAPALAHV